MSASKTQEGWVPVALGPVALRIADGMTTVEAAAAEPDFWGINDIQFHCRIGRTRAWQLVHEPDFPTPVAIGARRIWPRGEVLAFLDSCRQERISHGGDVRQENVSYVSRRVRSRSK